MTKENIVILDSGNFIKGICIFYFYFMKIALYNLNSLLWLTRVINLLGFRYELYCSSKSLSTPKCLVVCDISPDRAWELNKNRTEHDKYTRNTFDDLVMRYEEPNHSNRSIILIWFKILICINYKCINRWDSPLINLQLDDILPTEDIRKAIFEVATPVPNQSTINVRFNLLVIIYCIKVIFFNNI